MLSVFRTFGPLAGKFGTPIARRYGIYDLVYSEKEEEIDKQDEALIERLNILLTGVGEESVSKDELERLLGEAVLLGERQGFLNGVHFLAELCLEVIR